MEDVLGAAKMTWNQIDHLLLIGGSTRMPMVKKMVERISGKKVELDVNPDEAVALGAAVQAALESVKEGGSDLVPTSGGTVDLFGRQGITISDVTSQSLGVIQLDSETNQDKNTIVIPRNSKIPTKLSVGGLTVVDNQTELRIQVTQGEDEDPAFVTQIGESILRIPPYPKGSPIEITFCYDEDQTVQIEVFDLTAKQSLGTFEIDRIANLDDEQVNTAATKISNLDVN